MPAQVAVNDEQIADFCRRNHILRFSLFGSVLTGEFKPNSDTDVLVDYDPQYPVGFRIIDMEEELSRMFGGRRVDMVNRKYLNHRLRDSILTSAELHYAQK